jgi:hypothetical protein
MTALGTREGLICSEAELGYDFWHSSESEAP